MIWCHLHASLTEHDNFKTRLALRSCKVSSSLARLRHSYRDISWTFSSHRSGWTRPHEPHDHGVVKYIAIVSSWRRADWKCVLYAMVRRISRLDAATTKISPGVLFACTKIKLKHTWWSTFTAPPDGRGEMGNLKFSADLIARWEPRDPTICDYDFFPENHKERAMGRASWRDNHKIIP